jgi:hypothetical protein
MTTNLGSVYVPDTFTLGKEHQQIRQTPEGDLPLNLEVRNAHNKKYVDRKNFQIFHK